MADFNGAGRLDIGIANRSSSYETGVSVLFGNGDGIFAAPVNYAAGYVPQTIVTADFNGDGYADLVALSERGNAVYLLVSNGDGTFQPAVNYGVGFYPASAGVADFNSDGRQQRWTAGLSGFRVFDSFHIDEPAVSFGNRLERDVILDFHATVPVP